MRDSDLLPSARAARGGSPEAEQSDPGGPGRIVLGPDPEPAGGSATEYGLIYIEGIGLAAIELPEEGGGSDHGDPPSTTHSFGRE